MADMEHHTHSKQHNTSSYALSSPNSSKFERYEEKITSERYICCFFLREREIEKTDKEKRERKQIKKKDKERERGGERYKK